MATSSIFASVKIKDTKTAEAFVAAMEESLNSPFKHSGTMILHWMMCMKKFI